MKNKGIVSFLVSFIFFFVFLFILSGLVTFSYYGNQWYLYLFSSQLFSLPLLFYLFAGAVGAALLYSISQTYGESQTMSELEEYLTYLSNGEYSENLFSPVEKKLSKEVIEKRELLSLVLTLRQRMMNLSLEAQGQFKKETGASLESKEEILETERRRIARELHDSVSQQIFAAMMMISAINQTNKELPKQYQKQLYLIENILNESQSEMRALLLHLRPIKLEGKTLKQGIEQLLHELQTKTTIDMVWKIHDVHLNQTIEDHLFRIVQELLSNTLRHAKASLLEVYLSESNQSILLKIVDDGIGFDMNLSHTGSYGLKNIRERIFSMGGVVKILSFPDKGTSIEMRVPKIREGNPDDKNIVSR